MAGGSVTDPAKGYHLELATSHAQVSREAEALLREVGYEPKSVARQGNSVIYFKLSDHIEELLTLIGAPASATEIMSAKIEKEMRNQVNRLVNCETANMNKTVDAACRQKANIELIASTVGLDSLSKPLRLAAEARLAYPEVSLKELGTLMEPVVSKSGINHRMRKLEELADELRSKGYGHE